MGAVSVIDSMVDHIVRSAPRRLAGWVALCVCLSGAMLGWLGFQAVTEWQRNATLLASRRADAAVDLLVRALSRDMRGVQMAMLSPVHGDPVSLERLSDLAQRISGMFARYPYPEAFFTWRGSASPESVVFFTRRDRHPAWMPQQQDGVPFPVVVGREPDVARTMVERVERDIASARRFSAFDVNLQGVPYQVVATLWRARSHRDEPEAVFGFMVNLDWVRSQYFPDVASQVAQMTQTTEGIVLEIQDERGTPILAGQTTNSPVPARERVFPLLFFDPSLVIADPPLNLEQRAWTARARPVAEPTLLAANRGAQRTLTLAGLSALVLIAGFALTVRASRINANLAEMRSQFVSTVTHELKTPIATLRAISDNLAGGRAIEPQLLREFGQISVQETKRLGRLVDNLLAYAHITDVTDIYTFEAQSIHEIVDDSLREFAFQLDQRHFDVQIDIPTDLPLVRADRLTIELALSNLLDNAIRYSNGVRTISVRARRADPWVELLVSDKGVGIATADIGRVTQKFYRPAGAAPGGTGLGLAIVQRIVADHGGSLHIASELGVGTTVTLRLPIVETDK